MSSLSSGAAGVSRRQVLSTLGAGSVTAVVGLGGCLGRSDTADSISVAATEGEGRLFRRLAGGYVSEQTGIDVDVELFSYPALFEQNRTILGQEGDKFDLIFMDDPWFPEFSGDVDPVEEWLPESVPDEYIETTLDIARWPAPRGPRVPGTGEEDPTLRGLVVVGNTQVFAYNATYVEQVGYRPPETYRDVLEVGRAIDEQIEGASGFAIRGAEGNPVVANFFPTGFALAGRMFDENWQFQWDSGPGIDAVDYFTTDLAAVAPEGITAFDETEVVSALAAGDAAQAHVWPDAASLILEQDSPETDNIEFAVMPGSQTGTRAPQQGNWIAGINAYTDDAAKRACGEVLQSFVSAQAQEQYVQEGGVPFRHDTFQNNIDAEPWFEALYESLQNAQWRPRTPLWSDIESELGTRLHAALGGQTTPESAMSNAGETIRGLLDEHGYY